MKIVIRFLVFFILFSETQPANSQSPVLAEWKQDIKISLNSINKANCLRIDKQGNCYALGTTWFADSTKDILLIKINPEGNVEWNRTYDNPSHGDDIPMNMCIDNEGNIWVCGLARSKSNNADFLVVKFNPDGVPVSDEMYDGRDHLFDCATTITSDKNGNIYAGGYETSVDSGINMLVVKCRSDGSFLWNRKYSTFQMDVANKILTDDSSNVYICGTSNGGPHSSDIILQKYDSTGSKKWQFLFDGDLSQNDVGQFLSFDDSMNVYVSGFMNHTNDRSDIPILKLDRNGQLLQETFYNGHIADCGAINLNATHNVVYLTGGCDDYNISSNSVFLLQLDKAGKEKCTVTAPVDIRYIGAFDVNGFTVITGSETTHPESTLTPYMACYDSSALKWTYSDPDVYGLAHIVSVEAKNNNLYFLGDDAGEATGTIQIFKYVLNHEVGLGQKKRPTKKFN